MNPTADPVLVIERASKMLPDGSPLLTDIGLTIGAGSVTAIVGRSGSGKSTLLSIMGMLDRFDRGELRFLGRGPDLRATEMERLRREHVSFVFQRLSLLPHLSAEENVLLPLRHRKARLRREDRARGADLLEAVGLRDARSKRPRELSGGEQQRVAIARALISTPSLLLADEPTGALDVDTAQMVLELLTTQSREQGVALVVVTHDPNVAALADTTHALEAGALRISTAQGTS